MTDLFEDAEIISVYTRQDAINDGIFIDITETAKEAGIKYPTAVTSNLYHTYINPDPMPSGQDESGRLWDVLWMLVCAIKGMIGKTEGNMTIYPVSFYDGQRQREVTIWAVCEPTSPTDPAPAINIMLPEDY